MPPEMPAGLWPGVMTTDVGKLDPGIGLCAEKRNIDDSLLHYICDTCFYVHRTHLFNIVAI